MKHPGEVVAFLIRTSEGAGSIPLAANIFLPPNANHIACDPLSGMYQELSGSGTIFDSQGRRCGFDFRQAHCLFSSGKHWFFYNEAALR